MLVKSLISLIRNIYESKSTEKNKVNSNIKQRHLKLKKSRILCICVKYLTFKRKSTRRILKQLNFLDCLRKSKECPSTASFHQL